MWLHYSKLLDLMFLSKPQVTYLFHSALLIISNNREFKRKNEKPYLGIDAPLNRVDQVRPETLHLPESYPRYDVLAHHHRRDELLSVLLGGHAKESTRGRIREADEVWIILAHKDGEDRRGAGAERVAYQRQTELVRASRGVLLKRWGRREDF